MRTGRWFRHNQLLILAIIGTLTLHGVLLMRGSYVSTYDAWVHIFFGDHYARAWWSLWEPRWYTGFTMASYPPLTHQLIGLLSKFMTLPGAFGVIIVTASGLTTLGVYRFSRLWVNHRAASYAALLTVFSSSIAETIHVFGQLPTMFVMGVMLNALPFVWYWVMDGRVSNLLRAWALLMVAAAGHHVTTLFGMVFFSGPILATTLLRLFRSPCEDEPEIDAFSLRFSVLRRFVVRRTGRVWAGIVRAGIFGVGLIVTLVITVLPYWLWSRSDPITQITIPHASRDSFIVNSAAGLVFFLIPWGVLMFVLPYALYKAFTGKNWILGASLAGLSFVGTGGTTPLPALLLKGSFYILTLERFTFWATIVILPFAGQFIESLVHGRLGRWITGHFGVWVRNMFLTVFVVALIAIALFTANLTQFRKFQPAPIDMGPIVEFLAKDNHDKWRYMTLGFGDQMAWLSAQTTALNVEGNYHSARRLPELTSTPIERLDGAKYTAIPGLGSLQAFVTNPQRYNLKYIFVNDAFYEPLLYFAGWHRLGRLDNDVQVWERADVPPLPASIPAQIYPAWQRLIWGTLPVGSLVVTAVVFAFTTIAVARGWSFDKLPLVGKLFRRRWLARILSEPGRPPVPSHEEWQIWRLLLDRVVPRLRLTPLARRSLYGAGLALLVLAIVAGSFFLLRRKAVAPETILLNYYDDLDFKRFSSSYTWLATDLTDEEYLRWLSLQGGILASFAKLENLYIDIKPTDSADVVTADVTAEWLTALGTYPVKDSYTLEQTPQGWRIRFDVEAPPIPRETLMVQSQTTFYLDTPLTPLEEGALTRGVLDRTLLSVSDVRAVYDPVTPISFTPESYDAGRIVGRFEGLISLVGAVRNNDSFPAQVTLTGILRDADGNRLAETNVMDVAVHQLLPGESALFRIDFAGADASKILDLEQIASAQVIAQGVPTAYNLERPLVLVGGDTLYNASARAVDIPRVLVGYEDEDGLRWVRAVTLTTALRPGQSAAFERPGIPARLVDLPFNVEVAGARLTEWTGDLPTLVMNGYSR
ncbi:MAG: hypothetical protein IPK19_05085 [Chloroflexi bacterium]|nr:hypothetical protein [Chloroflexota bacterium]